LLLPEGLGVAYSQGAFRHLLSLLEGVPPGGSVLELGCQEINPDVETADIRAALLKIHGREFSEDEAKALVHDTSGRRYMYRIFEGSSYDFRYIDLYGPSSSAIICDLNEYVVEDNLRGHFDLVTNWGTTEHIFNQFNAMKCIHDFLKLGGEIFHSVPCTGYYNHGLINYHPIFFLFLANANNYDVRGLALSGPHFPYTMRESRVIAGAESWRGVVTHSGVVNCHLRKRSDRPFRPFTDFDRLEMSDNQELLPELREVLEWRYDLRILTP
jgi:hypothetical protein